MSAEEVIVALREAKGKLFVAKDAGLRAAGAIAAARNLVGHALGRRAAGSGLISAIHAREEALLGRVMGIDALVTRVDTAIDQARVIGDGRGSDSDGPPVD